MSEHRAPSHSSHPSYPDAFHDSYSRTVFGFWIYILSDFILFGTLFATYAVLHNNTFAGPSIRDVCSPSFMLAETLILLTSSFTIGLAGASAHRKNRNATISLFLISALLGIVFIGMLFMDFNHLISAGNSWKRSAFLSIFFTILGTHALHMIFAVLWTAVLIFPVWKEGITPASIRRLTCLKMFWQFLNIVWIFVFAFCLSDWGKLS